MFFWSARQLDLCTAIYNFNITVKQVTAASEKQDNFLDEIYFRLYREKVINNRETVRSRSKPRDLEGLFSILWVQVNDISLVAQIAIVFKLTY